MNSTNKVLRTFLLSTLTLASFFLGGRNAWTAMSLTKQTTMRLDNDPVQLDSAPGDPAFTLNCATTPSDCAQFTVKNATPNSVVTLTLPGNTNLTGPGADIATTAFSSSPVSGAFSTDATGQAIFYVGATRAALAANQTTGTYTVTLNPVSATVNGTTKSRNTDTETCTVIASLACSKTNDLHFGDAAQNDAAKTINPSTAPSGAGWAGSPSRASFSITGAANKTYSVNIAPASVTMITGAGGVNQTIVVNAFTFYSTTAASGVSGTLSAGGADTLYVGGTQAAIGGAQISGTYVSPSNYGYCDVSMTQ